MEKVNFKSLIEEVRFNNFVNSLLKMNEEQISVIASQLDEETRARVVSVLEAKLPPPKKVKVPDAKADAEAKVNQQVIDIIQKTGAKPSDELNPPASRPAADLKPGDLRAKFAKGPKEDPTIAGKGQPAADLKAGDMRSQFAKGPATDAGVAKADASFKDASKKIGARRAAEKSASAVDMPQNSMGNMKAKADTDVRTQARTDAEAKAKTDAIRGDTVKKVAKGLAGAAALGTAATVLSKSTGDTSTAASAEPAGTKMKVAKGDTLSQIAQKNKVSVADLMKANQGIKDVHKISVGQEIVVPKATNAPVYQGGIGTKAGPAKSQNIQKPKTVKEENENSLINAFLKIQASGSANLFEAAKKAKKDWDKDGKIESEKDEVWGSRFRAAGIQKEESEAEKAKKNPMSHERDAASSRIPNRELTPDEMPKKKVSKVVQTGKNTSTAYKVDEEVERLDEISDPLKRSYLDAAIIDHGERWSERAGPEHLTKRGHFKKSWLNSPERKKLLDKLQSRRSWIQKTAKDVTGQKHFSDLDGQPYNAGKIQKYSTEEVEKLDEADLMHIKVGEKVRLTNPKASPKHTVDKIKGDKVHITKDSGEKVVMPLDRIKRIKAQAMKLKENVEFTEAELAYFASIDEANPIAPVPDDYSGAAGGVSKRDLSDETVAEGIRGMRRKDTKFKDNPKKYSNEYPKSYRAPGTMSKSEMRDHIEASVRKYLKAGGKIKKD